MCGTPSTDGTGLLAYGADLAGSNAAWIPGSWPKPSSAPRHCQGQTFEVISCGWQGSNFGGASASCLHAAAWESGIANSGCQCLESESWAGGRPDRTRPARQRPARARRAALGFQDPRLGGVAAQWPRPGECQFHACLARPCTAPAAVALRLSRRPGERAKAPAPARASCCSWAGPRLAAGNSNRAH
jgi:hypothetical protein